MWRYDTFPPHNLEMKVTIPLGVTPINTLKVFEYLYSDQVIHWAFSDEGFSMWNSVQSTTILVSGCPVKSFGKLQAILSRVGQVTNDLQLSYGIEN